MNITIILIVLTIVSFVMSIYYFFKLGMTTDNIDYARKISRKLYRSVIITVISFMLTIFTCILT